MLTREIMGALALAILWVNTLLIAAAALKLVGAHGRRLRDLRAAGRGSEGYGLFTARVEGGEGPEGVLARHEIAQLGRAGGEEGGRRTIHFSDRTFTTAVLGGVVSCAEVEGPIRVKAGEGDVWPAREVVLATAGCDDPKVFDGAFEAARKARGHGRTVRSDVRAGDVVWLAGELRRGANGEWELGAGDRGLLVSAIDPRAWLRRKMGLAVLFVVLEVIAAAAVTALVLVPPVFDGWPSKIGGVLGLAFFLGVQPLGNAVRDALRVPSQAFVRGRWVEPTAVSARGAAVAPARGA